MMPLAVTFPRCELPVLQPRIIPAHVAAHLYCPQAARIFADLRFELGELHVLMIASSAK
jgi:hypothetical protein